MWIYFERTGGLAGMMLNVTIDTGSLSQDEARYLLEMIDRARFFELPAEMTGIQKGADQFLYRITVESEGRQHTVQRSETDVPMSLRPLLEWLIKAARRAMRAK